MKNYSMGELEAFARKIGYEVIAIEGEEEFCVLNGEDGMPFSFDQSGINDAMDILQQDAETMAREEAYYRKVGSGGE